MKTTPRHLTTGGVVLLAAATTWAAEGAGETDRSSSLLDLILLGGWAMWPLGVCSLTLAYLCIHNGLALRRSHFVSAGLVERILAAARDGWDGAWGVIRQDASAAGRCLASGLGRPGCDSWEQRLAATAEAIEAEDARHAAWIQYLNVVATVAPMIGLLGTVSGMIGAFDTMAAGGMGRPELLAGDIGEAMITTAAGLIIAIPALVAYFVFRDRLNRCVREAAVAAGAVLDELRARSGALPA